MKPLQQAIDFAGGPSALARILGVRPQHIVNWRHRGVPAERCIDIEDAVGGRVTRHDLRPDVFGSADEGPKPLRRSTAAVEGGPAAEATGNSIEPLSEAA